MLLPLLPSRHISLRPRPSNKKSHIKISQEKQISQLSIPFSRSTLFFNLARTMSEFNSDRIKMSLVKGASKSAVAAISSTGIQARSIFLAISREYYRTNQIFPRSMISGPTVQPPSPPRLQLWLHLASL